MFKKQIRNIPEGCTVWVEGKRIDDLRRLRVGKDENVFFIKVTQETRTIRCSARTREHLLAETEIQISVSIKDDSERIPDLIRVSGKSTYPDIRTLSITNHMEEVIQALKSKFITFAQQINYLDFQRGGFTEDFTKLFVGQFKPFVNFIINSVDVAPPPRRYLKQTLLPT